MLDAPNSQNADGSERKPRRSWRSTAEIYYDVPLACYSASLYRFIWWKEEHKGSIWFQSHFLAVIGNESDCSLRPCRVSSKALYCCKFNESLIVQLNDLTCQLCPSRWCILTDSDRSSTWSFRHCEPIMWWVYSCQAKREGEWRRASVSAPALNLEATRLLKPLNRTVPQHPVSLNQVLYDLFIAATTPNWIAFFIIAATEENTRN